MAARESPAQPAQECRSALRELASRAMTAGETGARLWRLVSETSMLKGQGAWHKNDTATGEDGKLFGFASPPGGELLPLPTPTVRALTKEQLDAAFPSDNVPTKTALDYAAKAWLALVITALNLMASNGRSHQGPTSPLSPAQERAVEHLLEQCVAFVKEDPSARMPSDWIANLKGKAHGYWGEPVYVAEPITLLQVLASLPARGVAASVAVCEILEGQLRDQLRDPESLLLPEAEWPHTTPRAATQLADDSEWPLLAQELWARGLVSWLPEEQLFAPRGKAVINGLFAVPKDKDVEGHPGLHVQRLICNLVPTNSYFRVIRGDVDELPYIMQWSAICLAEDEILTVTQEDMTCAFYLFRLPKEWLPYMAVGKPVRLRDLQGNSRARAESAAFAKGNTSGLGYLCLRVLPMGWASAVGVMQAIHRRILAMPPPQGAGLPRDREITKTRVAPCGPDQRLHEAWQAYLDNYASVHVRQRKAQAQAVREINEWHKATRAAWRRWNIPSAEDKSVSESTFAKELGCTIQGVRGALTTAVDRKLQTIGLSFFICSSPAPHRLWLATGAGRWNYHFQFRRAVSSVFFLVWRAIAEWQRCAFLPWPVAEELLMAVCLAPTMECQLRARPDLLVTCSDASETGAGIAAAAGLTAYGVRSVLALPQSVPPADDRGFALISLFGGIEAGARACNLLGLKPLRHVAVENEKTAVRATSETFPEARAYRDINEFTRTIIHMCLSGARITFVVVLGGSPCQALSGANATGTGFADPRSKLFFVMIRVIKDVKAEHHRVFYLGENVASMSEENREVFTKFMGVKPHRACASGISQVRRDRYYWQSWQVPASPGVTVTEEEGYYRVRFQAALPPAEDWVEPGWVFNGDERTRLPTFMRATPKKKETFLPAGIASTPADARRRWQRDQWRYPPYQYKREFMLRHKKQPRVLRPCRAAERERLMFLGTDFTRYALNPVLAKADPQALEDARCALIGNSFHAGVVALLLAPLFRTQGLLSETPTPDELVQRMGLRPGEIFVPGIDASLRRPRDFHRHDCQRRGHVYPSVADATAAVDASSTPELEAALFHSIIRAADYRGSDVRLDSGELLRPHAWPRRSIDPARWAWYTVLSAPFTREEHINALELKAAFLTLRWRTRSSKRVFTRFLHLIDSQVALSVLVKGRSSSWRLNRILSRINALTLAANLVPSYAYIMSEWNPSDRPSRRYMGRQRGQPRAHPKKAKPRASQRSRGVARDDAGVKATWTSRNRKFERAFDSTLGYPGEGPSRRPRDRRAEARPRAAKAKATKAKPTHRDVHRSRVERVIARRTRSERMRARKGISLRDSALAPLTRRLYREAFLLFWLWVGRSPPDHCLDALAYDALLAEYVEHCWESGLTRAMAGNALSASLVAYPELRRRGTLAESWYFLKAWSRIEVPNRAPPMPADVCLAAMLFFLWEGDYRGAFLLAAGFDGFLRTGEMTDLRWEDVQIDARGLGVLNLSSTKSGQRHAAFEASVILDPLVGRLWNLALRQLPRGTSLQTTVLLGTPADFYARFQAAMVHFGLHRFAFRPYSIRRGGATAFYRRTYNLSATIERGRWSQARVARIYINDGLAKEVELQFSTAENSRIAKAKAELMRFLAEQGIVGQSPVLR